jgi:hypothetical protein
MCPIIWKFQTPLRASLVRYALKTLTGISWYIAAVKLTNYFHCGIFCVFVCVSVLDQFTALLIMFIKFRIYLYALVGCV